jgi:predicted dehydrogenase
VQQSFDSLTGNPRDENARAKDHDVKDKALKLGIVGAGYIAAVHLPVLSRLGVTLAAICDIDEDRARSVAKRYCIQRVYTSFVDMLEAEALDVVDILTPPNTHADLAEQALQNDCHCLIEKPLALTVADADRIIRLAKEKALALRVIHNYSFLPCIRKARDLVSSGILGKIVDVDIRYVTPLEMERYFDPSHWIHRLPGGVFSDIAPHLAMLILDFLENVNHVEVMTRKNLKYTYVSADELKVMVEAANGLGSFTLCFSSAVLRFSVDIVGTKGSLLIDADTNTVVCYKALQDSSQLLGRTAKGMRALRDIYQRILGLSINTGHMLLKSKGTSESHEYLIRLSLNDINNGENGPVSLEKCREVVSLLETVYALIPR